jgi:hypothetical protein
MSIDPTLDPLPDAERGPRVHCTELGVCEALISPPRDGGGWGEV